MGHLVNPISLRLGITQNWKSQWYKSTRKEYVTTLKEDFMLYNYIESFFKYAKLVKRKKDAIIKFTKKERKQKKRKYKYLRPSQRKRIRVKRYTVSQLVEKLSLIFSHANIGRISTNLIVNMHIYDGALQVIVSKDVQNFESNLFDFKKFESNKSKDKNFNNKEKERFSFFRKKSNKPLNAKKFLRVFFNKKKLKKNKKTENNVSDFIYQQYFKYVNNVVDINNVFTINNKINNIKKTFNTLSTNKTNRLLREKKKNIVKYFSNLEVRFFKTRLLYLGKCLHSIFMDNLPKYKNNKIKKLSLRYKKRIEKKPKKFKRTKKVKHYMKIIKLFYIFHIKNMYASKLQNIFVLRVLLYAILKLKNKFKKKIKETFSVSLLKLKKQKQQKEKKPKKFKTKYNHKNKNRYNNFRRKNAKSGLLVRKNSIHIDYNFFNKQKRFKNEKLFKKRNYTFIKKINIEKIYEIVNKLKRNMLKLDNLILYVLCASSEYSFENKTMQLYKIRFKLWFYISRILFENIKTIVEKNNHNIYKQLKISYFGMTNTTPSAAMIANYITNRLYKKYTIFETVKPIANDLSKNFKIDGFKISCAGRLTKKQRAGLYIEKQRRVPANTFDSFIDYATSIVRLRHGVCGLKIWITRKKRYKTFTYNFSYVYNI